MRARLRMAALPLLLVVLAGCASIPTSGPVEVEGDVVVNEAPPEPVALVSPPADGASPEEVVAGFLTANAVPADDYAIARTFLSPEVQESWNPQAGAIIYSDGAGYSLSARTVAEVRLVANEEGRLTADAQYVVAAPDSRIDQPFVLRRIDGQWRILELRDGLFITARDLARAYDGYDVYFLAPDASTLVPDRVLLADRPGLATTIVRRLLAGPSAWLAPAVTTAFPGGTQLAIDATPIENGVITVDLTDEVLKADNTTRELLAGQLVWTLTSLDGLGISGVAITVSGQPLAIEGAGSVLRKDQFESLDPNVLRGPSTGFASLDGRLSSLTSPPSAVEGVFGQGSARVGLAAVSMDGTRAGAEISEAALRGTVYIAGLDAAGSPSPRLRLSNVTALTFDRTGTLFAAGGRQGVVRAIPPTGPAIAVAVAGAPVVLRMSMARDGTRVALVIRRPNAATDELVVARVVRDGVRVRFDGLRRIENEVSAIIDIAWADADRLAVLAPSANGTTQVLDVVVGGTDVVERGGVPSMVDVAAAPGSPLLVEASGVIYEESGATWRRIGTGVSPSYPG
jgi:Lipoprotein LpqB beta-propeller domain/Sporulation and spore germination